MAVVHTCVDDADDDVARSHRHVPSLVGLDLGQSPELVVRGVVRSYGRVYDVVGLRTANLPVAPKLRDPLLDAAAGHMQHVRPCADRAEVLRARRGFDGAPAGGAGSGAKADEDYALSGLRRR